MKIVIALGGNALLEPEEAPTVGNQRRNMRRAADAVMRIARDHRVVVTHGNGPQVGFLALQAEEAPGHEPFPLDVLGAQTQGMIGYVVAQELRNALPDLRVAPLLTQVEVDPADPAFEQPTKPIGPVYDEDRAHRLARERGWRVARDRDGWRRVVPSPHPVEILEVDTVRRLVDDDVLVVCAGGGGIPVVVEESGRVQGVEAVIDKDRTASLLAREIGADALLILTDVDGIYRDWGTDRQERIERLSVRELRGLELADGSMGPKADASAAFVEATGGFVGIGSLDDAGALLEGGAGTRIEP